ncbi:proteasome assembly chaperone 2-like [Artemia franciscana]|uniref:proteasome assembly chaperone 2-like n=1 Tax=Artemia franciscana TaxID=6661 RepID=UPI0032DAB72E
MDFYIGRKIEGQGYFLVLPSLSLGNVGQLSIDLLLQSFSDEVEKVGYLNHPSLLPVVGHSPYSIDVAELYLGCEVYIIDKLKLIVVQIRTLLTKSRRSDFVRKLVSWAKELKVNEMILLGSSSSNVRKDQQMVGPQYRYLKNDFSTLEYPRSENWIKFEPLPKYILEVNRNENIEGGDSISIPFGGICKAVYQASNEIRMPMSAILSFTSEGNNIPDALLVIDKFSEALQISSKKSEWVFPPSWIHLYGRPAPKSLFG